ncbi:MAG: FHA domain-containing protein [Pirellulaceae bacterium]
MQVKLKVIGGKNDGREIKISVPEFIIGRGEEAHLKPASDLISRKHCSIKVEGPTVIISDMGSRNGTFVNGEQLAAPHEAKIGDVLRVGRLQFEVLIDVTQPGAKRPKVEGVAEAAARTAETAAAKKPASLDESISDWLSEEVEDGEKSLSDTTQLSLEDTKAILAEAERKAREKELAKKSGEDSGIISTEPESSDDSSKKKPGKLPPLPKHSHDSSKGAADDVLRKFFNRR